MKPTNHAALFQLSIFTLIGISILFGRETSAQQPAVLSTTLSSDRIVIIPDANTPSNQVLVPGLPVDAQPHGVAYFGSDNVLVADGGRSRVFVIKVSTASLLSTIDTAAAGYDGTGTIAISPDGSAALAMGGTGLDSLKLKVIHAPFNASSTITQVDIGGSVATYQTQAIVFNNAGRAFMLTTGGIFVLDPPYASVAFSFYPLSQGSGAIAISPDGNTILVTCACTTSFESKTVRIFQAPFTESSTAAFLFLPDSNRLDGISIAPDGASAIVVSAFPVNGAANHAAAIFAPFSSSSVVANFTLPPGVEGFEDVGISADSQIAILTGNSTSEPPVFIKAPFTSAGAIITSVPVGGVTNSARGQGAARFRPTLAFQLTTALSRKIHGSAGAFDVNLALSGTPSVECRSGGANGNHTLVFTFSTVGNLVSGNASVSSGAGSVTGAPAFSGNTMTVNLTGVTNAQTTTVALTNITDSLGQVLPSTSVSAGFLLGDTNGTRSVNAADIGQTKSFSGLTADATNFRNDVNVSGLINAPDIGQVKAMAGTSLPP